MKLKEYQSMVYVKLRSINLPATVTNKRSNDAERLVDDLVKKKLAITIILTVTKKN
jgi:hypothetical protein